MKEKNKIYFTKDKLSSWLIGLAFFGLLIWGFYGMFIKHSNEIGFLGMDKVGRQVFIQSFDAYLDPNVDVDSEFSEYVFPVRLILGEPLRTTLKFDIRDEREFQATPQSVDAFLSNPATLLVNEYRDKITMNEEYEVTVDELNKLMEEKNVNTISDLLSGFGFEKFEVYSRGSLVKSVQLPRTQNVVHVGGD